MTRRVAQALPVNTMQSMNRDGRWRPERNTRNPLLLKLSIVISLEIIITRRITTWVCPNVDSKPELFMDIDGFHVIT